MRPSFKKFRGLVGRTTQNNNHLAPHSMTLGAISFEDKVKIIKESGFEHIGLWRYDVMGISPIIAKQHLDKYNLKAASYCRAGYFANSSALARNSAIFDAERCIEEAATLNATCLIIVPGADPKQSMSTSLAQIYEAFDKVLPKAESMNVRLALEPQHPLFAAKRGAINSMRDANDFIKEIDSPNLGICIDTYQQWWDSHLKEEILRCGEMKKIFAVHMADWKVTTNDFVSDRGLPGEGCIDLKGIKSVISETGFEGPFELEVLSERWAASSPVAYLNEMRISCLNLNSN